MRTQILATAVAVACAGAFAAAQDAGAPGQQSNPAPPSSSAQVESRAGEQGTTTLTGCVYREEDVPGRTPNIAERVGILEDYILAVSMSPGAGERESAVGTSGAERPGAAGQAGEDRPAATGQDRADASPDRAGDVATGTSGRTASGHSMFKLEQIDDDKLQAVVGKRVEVMGKIDADAGDRVAGAPATDASIGPDQIELPEFEVSSMREVPGDCPASPQAN